jgi:predicted AlkP superfamily phosphohydrolase/phosphomutase
MQTMQLDALLLESFHSLYKGHPLNRRAKILFLAIDAGDKVLIRDGVQDGTLPVLGRLIGRGLVGETRSVEGFYEGSTWPSFYTGVNPARHGFHRLTQIRPGTYEFYRCTPGEFITRKPFWDILSTAGKRVAILDIPLSGISPRVKGIQMVEWGSHDAAYGFRTWPKNLKREVLKRFGPHPVDTACDNYGRSAQDFCRFRDRLIEGIRKKTELTLHYLKNGEWDFFAQVFTEAHCAGHQCWHLHDPAHPNHDRDIVSITGDPMREVYRAIDGAIGRILEQVDEKTTVWLLATHRMAHNIGASFMLEAILEKLNYLKKNPPGSNPAQNTGLKSKIVLARRGWEKLPIPLQSALKPALAPLYHSARRIITGGHVSRMNHGLDLTQSSCFPHENGNLISGIRMNLKGREPSGLVEPGDELEKLYRRIGEDLYHIVDKESCRPIVNRVLRTSELFKGEYIDHLPDLLVEWREDQLIGTNHFGGGTAYRLQLVSDQIGLMEGEYAYCRTGDHRPEGLFAVFGPGIGSGAIGRSISIMDFAPTFLTSFGLNLPDLDGKPISEIFR